MPFDLNHRYDSSVGWANAKACAPWLWVPALPQTRPRSGRSLGECRPRAVPLLSQICYSALVFFKQTNACTNTYLTSFFSSKAQDHFSTPRFFPWTPSWLVCGSNACMRFPSGWELLAQEIPLDSFPHQCLEEPAQSRWL